MIARPAAAAALGCRQCQSAVFRAVLTRPATSSALRSLPARQTLQLPLLTRRLYSQERALDSTVQKEATTPASTAAEAATENKQVVEELELEEEEEEKESEEADDNVPWFLEVEAPRHPESQHQVTLPTIPEDAPKLLGPMVKYVFEDMGLDDISLMDLRDLDPPAALGPNLIMLFGTARSERHLHIASGRFVRYLRKKFKVEARADGLIGPGELRTKLRRLRKKAKLMGTNTAIIPGGDNGISTGWVCVNFSFNERSSGETASFDEGGRFSGFGTTVDGTTIVIQCMTEPRRNELELETLWKGLLKRSLQSKSKVRGAKSVDEAELEALVDSKVQLPTNHAAQQWQAMQRASQQHRYYSTTARRLNAATPDKTKGTAGDAQHVQQAQQAATTEASQVVGLDEVGEHIRHIQVVGLPFTQDELHGLLKAIFLQPSASAESSARERLELAEQLLQTADERGMDITSSDVFVLVLESLLSSPAYGPELQRAGRNFELLMAQERCQPSDAQVLRLMEAYARVRDWARFWDAFRMPARFGRERAAALYELAYRAMAETGSQAMCIDALRWVYPEMRSQTAQPVPPLGPVYRSLRACIVVADPGVEYMAAHPEYGHQGQLFQVRRYNNREFLKVFKEVEETHRQLSDRGL